MIFNTENHSKQHDDIVSILPQNHDFNPATFTDMKDKIDKLLILCLFLRLGSLSLSIFQEVFLVLKFENVICCTYSGERIDANEDCQ